LDLISEIRFWLYQKYFALSHNSKTGDALEKFNLELSQLKSDQLQTQLSELIRRELRKNPTWIRGHLELAELSLQLNDVATAYASAHAVLQLASSGKNFGQAKYVLARAFLRRADAAQALPLFLEANAYLGENLLFKEDLAACYMANEDFAGAYSILSGLPDDKLSSASKAALQFVKSKLN